MSGHRIRAVGAFISSLEEQGYALSIEGGEEYWSKQNVTLYWEPNQRDVPTFYVMVTSSVSPSPFADAVYSTLSHRDALVLADLLEREVNG